MKNSKVGVAILMLVGLLGALAFLSLINCNDDNCCPIKIAFQSQPEWACPGSATETAIFFKVDYQRKNKEPCKPQVSKVSLIKNGTEDIPLTFDSAPAGTYTGKLRVPVDPSRDTTFELIAIGEDGCVPLDKKIAFKIVGENSSQELSFYQGENTPESCILTPDAKGGDTQLCGAGVKVTKVTNESDYDILVRHDESGKPGHFIAKKGSTQDFTMDFDGQRANGYWEVEISDPTFCQRFRSLTPEQRVITLKLDLSCK